MDSTYNIVIANDGEFENVFHLTSNLTEDFTLGNILPDCEGVGSENPFVNHLTSRGVRDALSLDLSQNSTGIALLIDGELRTYNLRFKTNKAEVYETYAYSFALRSFLELFKGYSFDLITVEENVLGSNGTIDFITLRKLIVMNYVVDDLIQEGTLITKRFDRIPVPSWKSDLNYLTNDAGKYMDSKGQVQENMRVLDCPVIEQFSYVQTKAKMERNGFQDRLDACGILISGVLRLNGEGKVKKQTKAKSKRVDYKFAVYTTLDDVYDYNPDVEHVDVLPFTGKSIENKIQQLLKKDMDNPENFFTHFVLKVKNLGEFGIKHELNDLGIKEFYIYVSKEW